MAAWTIAYIRDSARPFPLAIRQAASAVLAAFRSHLVTESALAGLAPKTSSDRHRPISATSLLFTRPPSSAQVELDCFIRPPLHGRPPAQRSRVCERPFSPGGSGRQSGVDGQTAPASQRGQ